MTALKLFLATFNINGKDLDAAVLSALLQQDMHADLYVLALQEFPYPPAQQIPADEAVNEGAIPRHRYSRSGPVEESNAALYGNLKALLPHANVVVDVAMGEPEISTTDAKGKKLDWYGFIRLIVLVREGLNISPSPFVCPCGDKATVEDPSNPYSDNAAPDKGGVGVFIPEMDLLLVNCHLHGTNKYEVPEEHFESHRIEQLHTIYRLVDSLFGREATEAPMILCGDVNFRVEVHSSPEDKTRCGRDFTTVMDAVVRAREGEATLEPLFVKYDRLRRLMQSERCPLLLRGCDDLLAVPLSSTETQIFPSFTYKTKAFPRVYGDKRTPAWPDRILIKKLNPQRLHMRDIQEIVVSDHSPVVASLEVPFDIHIQDQSEFQSECTTMSSASIEEASKDVLIDTTIPTSGRVNREFPDLSRSGSDIVLQCLSLGDESDDEKVEAIVGVDSILAGGLVRPSRI